MTEAVACGLCGSTIHRPGGLCLTIRNDECHVCGLITCGPCWRRRQEEHDCATTNHTCANETCARADAATEELLYG